MPKVANPLYSENQRWSEAGNSLGKALFGDPNLAGQLELRNAQTRNEMQEGIGNELTNMNRMQLGDVLTDLATPAGEDGTRAYASPDQFRMGLPKAIGTIANADMGGDLGSILAQFGAYSGDDDFATQSLVGQGKIPGPDFAPSTGRADDVSARNSAEDIAQDAAKPRSVDQRMGDVFTTMDPLEQEALTRGKVASDTTVKNVQLPDGSRTTAIGNTYVDPAGNTVPLPYGSQVYGVESTGEGGGGVLEKPVSTALQKQQIALNSFKGLASRYKQYATDNPTNFGIAGLGKSTLQQLAVQGDTLGLALSSEAQEAMKTALQNPNEADPLDVRMFDPGLPAAEVLANVLAYRYATAIQGNERISDADAKDARRVIGDPLQWLNNAQSTTAKMDELITQADGINASINEIMGGNLDAQTSFGQPVGGGLGDEMFGTPAGAAPEQVQSDYQEGEVLTNPETGAKIQLKNNQWVPVQ